MQTNEEIYQSILKKLSQVPVVHLKKVDALLEELQNEVREKNQKEILNLAGSWNDMSEDDFQEYLQFSKQTGKKMFKDRLGL